MKKILFIASDHAGFDIKCSIISLFKSLGWEVKDLGPLDDSKIDYPLMAKSLCHLLLKNEDSKGVLICGTGIGMSIASNRFKHIRATICWDEYTAYTSRAHNNSNVLCLASRVTPLEDIKKICKIWATTKFEEGRHKRRLKQIDNMQGEDIKYAQRL